MDRRLLIGLGILVIGGLVAARLLIHDPGARDPRQKARDPIPDQLERLRSGTVEQRRTAALGLLLNGREQATRIVPAFREALSDADGEVRTSAVRGLAEFDTVDNLRELARSTDRDQRRFGLLALGRMGKRGTAGLPELLAGLEDKQPTVAIAAALALKRLELAKGEPPVALRDEKTFAGQWAHYLYQKQPLPESRALLRGLVSGLSDEEILVRGWSAATLEELASALPTIREARPELEKAFRDPHAGLFAAGALSYLARSDQSVADFLVAGLTDPDPAIRRNSARALGNVASRNGDASVTIRNANAVMALSKLLNDRDENLRMSAVVTLGQIGPLSAPTAPALLRILEEYGTQPPASMVLAALGRIGPAAKEVMPILLRTLAAEDSSPQLRKTAESALSQIGASGTAALHEAMTDKDVRIRRGAARALGVLLSIPPREAIGPLLKALDDADTGVRVEAALGIWRKEPTRIDVVLPVLIAGVDDVNLLTARTATAALVELGPLALPAVPTLRNALKSHDPALSDNAALALERIGPLGAAAVPELTARAKFSVEAIRALGAMGPAAREAVPELVSLIRVRSDLSAALALASIDPTNKDGLKVLLANIGGPNRVDVWVALGRLGPIADAAVKELLAQEYEGMNVLLPTVLARFGPDTVPALREALKKPGLREPICVTLAEFGPVARAAVPDVAPLLKDPNVRVATQSVRTLARLGPAGVGPLRELLSDPKVLPELILAFQGQPVDHELIEPLTLLLRDGPTPTRLAVCTLLASLGASAREALPTLRPMLEERDPLLRVAVGMAIASIDMEDKASLHILIEMLSNSEVRVRIAAAQSLGKLGDRASIAIPELRNLSTDTNDEVRAAALSALAGIAERAAKPAELDGGRLVPLLTKALDDRSDAVRRSAAHALAAPGPAAAPGVPGLTRLVEDERLGACNEAVVALGRIGPAARAAIPAIRESLAARPDHVEGPSAARVLAVARALWQIDPGAKGMARDVVILLQPALAEEWTPGVAPSALDLLAEMGPAAAPAAPSLCCKLVSRAPEVRARAAEVLGRIGPEAKPAVPMLVECAKRDPDTRVRKQAEEALAKVLK
jgi:HEAT repeat protein